MNGYCFECEDGWQGYKVCGPMMIPSYCALGNTTTLPPCKCSVIILIVNAGVTFITFIIYTFITFQTMSLKLNAVLCCQLPKLT